MIYQIFKQPMIMLTLVAVSLTGILAQAGSIEAGAERQAPVALSPNRDVNQSDTPTPTTAAPATNTPDPTSVPPGRQTDTPTPTPTITPTATNTPTASNTPTPTNTSTPTNTPTATATNTPTNTPTSTPYLPPFPTADPSTIFEIDCSGLDLVYVLDRSSSMLATDFGGGQSRMEGLKEVVLDNNDFLQTVSNNNLNLSLVTFGFTGTLDEDWTTDIDRVNSTISSTVAYGNTAMWEGIDIARTQILALGGDPGTPIVILVGDGVPTAWGATQAETNVWTRDAIDQLAAQTNAKIFSVGIGSFNAELLEYAASTTDGVFIQVATSDELEIALRVYFQEVCDDLDLQPTMDIRAETNTHTIDPVTGDRTDYVRLEDRVVYDIGLRANLPIDPDIEYVAANNFIMTVTLNTEDQSFGSTIDHIEVNGGLDLDCSVTPSQEQVVCKLDNSGLPEARWRVLPPGTLIDPLLLIYARVPGGYEPNRISGSVEVTTTQIDINAFNNTDSDSINVQKKWVYLGEGDSGLKAFSHIIYDDTALTFTSGTEIEHDRWSDELTSNPLQVPFGLSVGAETQRAPRLMTEYCFEHYDPTTGTFPSIMHPDSCSDGEHYIEGSYLLTQYSVTTATVKLQSAISGLETIDQFPITNIDGDPVEVALGGEKLDGSNRLGRLAENLDTGSSISGCNIAIGSILNDTLCMRYFNVFSTAPLDYQWTAEEMTHIMTLTNGGRSFDCSAYDECVVIGNAQPSLIEFVGRLQGSVFFYDPVRLKGLSHPTYGANVFEITLSVRADGSDGIDYSASVSFVAPFVEPEER